MCILYTSYSNIHHILITNVVHPIKPPQLGTATSVVVSPDVAVDVASVVVVDVGSSVAVDPH